MNKTALITGGSRGIGLGIAIQLANEGINLAINGVRDEMEVIDALNKLKSYEVDVVYCKGDISKKADRDDIIDKIKAHFGCLNYLVNNAGVAPKQRNDLLETTEESYDYVMDINLKGPFFLTQKIAAWMLEQQKKIKDYEAGIIVISSISSSVASINRGEYCIAKAGLGMLTSLYAARLGKHSIPVYEIRPGIIHTDMTTPVKDKYDALFAEGLTIQERWGLPHDIGKAAASLIRGDFPYSSGQVFMVDGGLTVQRL